VLSDLLLPACIQYLNEQLIQGVLPISELSRDNMRELFRESLGIDFANWDKFDSVCNRLDGRKKGFVSCDNVLQTFHSLPALMLPVIEDSKQQPGSTNLLNTGGKHAQEGLPLNDDKQQQLCRLLLLTITCDALGYKQVQPGQGQHLHVMDIQSVFADLCSNNPSLKESFSKLCKQQHPGSGSMKLNESSVLSSKTNKLVEINTVTTEIHLIADVLYELSHLHLQSLLADVDYCTHRNRRKGRRERSKARSLSPPASPSRRTRTLDKYSSHANTAMTAVYADTEYGGLNTNLVAAATYLQANIREFCYEVAQSLAIYDSTSRQQQSVLAALATVFVTYDVFRLQCFLYPPDEHKCMQAYADAHSHAHSHSHTQSPQQQQQRQRQLCEHFIQTRQEDLQTMLGTSKGQQAISRAYGIDVNEVSRCVCELVGIPVPHGGLAGLTDDQVSVDVFVRTVSAEEENGSPDEDDMFNDDTMRPRSAGGANNKKSMLQEKIQAIRDSRHGHPRPGSHSTAAHHQESIVTRTHEGVIHKQDLELLSAYVAHLHAHAANSKRKLNGLLHLWKAVTAQKNTPKNSHEIMTMAKDSIVRAQDLLKLQSRDAAILNEVRVQQVNDTSTDE
jgi:hypothetical protein